jgi:hypothetical protein
MNQFTGIAPVAALTISALILAPPRTLTVAERRPSKNAAVIAKWESRFGLGQLPPLKKAYLTLLSAGSLPMH